MRNIQAVKSVDWDITYQRSRYSSLAAVLGSKTPRSAALIRTRVHALHSLSAQGITGDSEVPAYDRCYIPATDVYCNVFRTGRHCVRQTPINGTTLICARSLK